MNGMSDRAFLECIDAKFEHVIERLAEAQNAPAAPSTTTTSGVHFHGSAGLSVLSAAAILAAISAVCIVAAWRSADMRELTALRERAAEDRQTIADMQALSRTDRLLLNSLKVDIAKLSAETKPK